MACLVDMLQEFFVVTSCSTLFFHTGRFCISTFCEVSSCCMVAFHEKARMYFNNPTLFWQFKTRDHPHRALRLRHSLVLCTRHNGYGSPLIKQQLISNMKRRRSTNIQTISTKFIIWLVGIGEMSMVCGKAEKKKCHMFS